MISKASWEKEYFLLRVHNSKHCPEFVYVAINLRIILEVVYGIFLGALVLGQPKYFLCFNSHAESMPVFLTVSLHSFFSEEIILTGNNFKPGRVSVGGEGTRRRGQRIGRVSKTFKKLFGNLPISKVTKTPVKLLKVVYLMKCFM